jgi:hypothetical protein
VGLFFNPGHHTGNVRPIDARILKWLLKKCSVIEWTESKWFRVVSSGGSCEHDNEHSSFTEDGELLHQLNDLSPSQEVLCSMT